MMFDRIELESKKRVIHFMIYLRFQQYFNINITLFAWNAAAHLNFSFNFHF